MEIIELDHPYSKDKIIPQDIVLALGFFDGVHRGHQHVIEVAKQKALDRNLPLVVMTFDLHPQIFYTDLRAEDVEYISNNRRKFELFDQLGVDFLYLVHYSYSFGHQRPQDFVNSYMVGLHAKVVVAGFDYTYGPKELANMTTLPRHAQGRFEVVKVAQLSSNHHKIGSRFILDKLRQGKLEAANKELGYFYQTHGQVIHGEKRGRLLGYPTANIAHQGQQLVPKIGVYVAAIRIEDKWHAAMASIGFNVTFPGSRNLCIEVHIFDFNQDIYNQWVDIRWCSYLREEIKFNNVDDLIKQLGKDEEEARHFFDSHPEALEEGDYYEKTSN